MNEFSKIGFINVENILSPDICEVFTNYALFKEKQEFSPESDIKQVPGNHSVYCDHFSDSLLLHLKPKMEMYTGLKLCPTFSYYRVYRPGAILKRHTDRISCEISTSICMGYQYNSDDTDYKWPLYIDKRGEDVFVTHSVGDGLIYRGSINHGRDSFICGKGSYLVQIFFHYVDVNGPYYPEYKYDKRLHVGLKQ